jgi:hypothetical protein
MAAVMVLMNLHSICAWLVSPSHISRVDATQVLSFCQSCQSPAAASVESKKPR